MFGGPHPSGGNADRSSPVMCIFRKHGNQCGYRGHVLNLPQDVQGFLDKLPSTIAHIPVSLVRRHGVDNTRADFRVCPECVMNALQWLKTNNCFYQDIEIDLGLYKIYQQMVFQPRLYMSRRLMTWHHSHKAMTTCTTLEMTPAPYQSSTSTLTTYPRYVHSDS